ncbi:hypothetical protein BT93_K0663 [Corymbia citriodora subsp. variegata]|nr:hypothetical protein BT93_K0663 [Corymbia citriodora subsp. variegata]
MLRQPHFFPFLGTLLTFDSEHPSHHILKSQSAKKKSDKQSLLKCSLIHCLRELLGKGKRRAVDQCMTQG